MRISIFPVLILATISCQAEQIYRCTTETGKTVFSQLPCGKDAESVEVEVRQPGISSEESIERHNAVVKSLDASAKRARKRRLQAKLEHLIGIRNGLNKKKQKKVSELQKDLREAYDFREKAVIESKIEQVNDKYWYDRQRLNDKIHDLRLELVSCCD